MIHGPDPAPGDAAESFVPTGVPVMIIVAEPDAGPGDVATVHALQTYRGRVVSGTARRLMPLSPRGSTAFFAEQARFPAPQVARFEHHYIVTAADGRTVKLDESSVLTALQNANIDRYSPLVCSLLIHDLAARTHLPNQGLHSIVRCFALTVGEGATVAAGLREARSNVVLADFVESYATKPAGFQADTRLIARYGARTAGPLGSVDGDMQGRLFQTRAAFEMALDSSRQSGDYAGAFDALQGFTQTFGQFMTESGFLSEEAWTTRQGEMADLCAATVITDLLPSALEMMIDAPRLDRGAPPPPTAPFAVRADHELSGITRFADTIISVSEGVVGFPADLRQRLLRQKSDVRRAMHRLKQSDGPGQVPVDDANRAILRFANTLGLCLDQVAARSGLKARQRWPVPEFQAESVRDPVAAGQYLWALAILADRLLSRLPGLNDLVLIATDDLASAGTGRTHHAADFLQGMALVIAQQASETPDGATGVTGATTTPS